MEESTHQFTGKKGANVLLNVDHKKSRIKKHAHEIAFTTILELASKTTIIFGKTLVLVAFHAIKYVISSEPYIAILDSAESQIGNFLSEL